MTQTEARRRFGQHEADRPALAGQGPAEVSTCRDLSVLPGWVADVNGYYRELGVPASATRAQIGRAYQARDGQSSDRLTFVVKQLLNPEVRRAYDRCLLGERFLDPWIQRELYLQMKRAAMARADQEVRAGRVASTREYESVVDAIMDWLIAGFEGTLPDVLDEAPATDDAGSAPAKSPVFPYSYYLWKTQAPLDPEQRLAGWQRLLLQAFAERNIRTRFAVGLHGMKRRHVFARVGFRDVFLFDRHLDPDIEVARMAVWLYTNAPVTPTHHDTRNEILL